MAINLTNAVATAIADDSPVGKVLFRTLINDLIGGININNTRSARFYHTRADAVLNADSLDVLVSTVVTVEDNELVVRSRGATGDDPLFPTGDRWGATLRLRLGDEVSAQRGTLGNGLNLNNVWRPGTYFLTANGGYLNLPADIVPERAHHLIVSAQGDPAGAGETRFPVQKIVQVNAIDGYRPEWTRVFDRENTTLSTGSWTRSGEASSVQFLPRLTVAPGADLSTIHTPGRYFLGADGGFVSFPAQADPAKAFFMDVAGHQASTTGPGMGSFISQRMASYTFAETGTPSQHQEQYFRQFSTSGPPTLGINQWMNVDPFAGSRVTGLTIPFLGDSITEGNGTFSFPPLLSARLRADVINGGFGGCRMANHTGLSVSPLYDPMCMYRISERIRYGNWGVLTDAAQALFEAEGDDNRPQAAALAAVDWATVRILPIAFGTNDFTAGVPIGTDDSTVGTSFKGAINFSLNNILTTYPLIQPVFCTPIWRLVSGVDSNDAVNALGLKLTDYRNAIIECAALWQAPVIDLYAVSGFNAMNQAVLIPDGTHPYTAAGMQRMADRIGSGLESLV